MESIVNRLIRNALVDTAITGAGWTKSSDQLAADTQAAVSVRRAAGISPWRETWSYQNGN